MKIIRQDLRKTIASSGVSFIFRIFGLATSFFTTLLITRLFGVGVYGNYALIFTVSQAAGLILTFGIPNTLIKIIGNHNLDYRQAKKLLAKALKITLILSIIPILIFYFGSSYLAINIFENQKLINYFLIVSFSLPLFVVHEIFIYFLIATKNFMKYNFFMFVVPNVLLLLFLLLINNINLSDYFTFLAFSVSILITVLLEFLTIFKLEKNNATIPFTSITLLKTASPLMFSGLLLYLLNWTDVIVLGLMVDEKQVGIYNIAFKVGSVGFLVIVSVSTIITPKIAALYGENNISDLKKLIHNSTRLIACLSIPIVLVLILLRKFILSLFGADALQGEYTLIIVSIGVLFSAIAGNVDQILNMTNNQKVLRNITAICFFVNLILNILLIPHFGIEGSAFASLITNVILNLFCLYYLKKRLGFYTLF
jgi:O-antigen/teichoic acid export membrane protein